MGQYSSHTVKDFLLLSVPEIFHEKHKNMKWRDFSGHILLEAKQGDEMQGEERGECKRKSFIMSFE